jgi:hypothetical protein
LDNLQGIVNQIAPNNEFQDWVLGTPYEKKNAPWPAMIKQLQQESLRGDKMDIGAINRQFADDVRLQVWRYTGPNERKANDMQKAAIRANLEQLRHAVSVEDVFGKQQ